MIPDLPKALRRLVRQIPKGRVTTYGDLAAALGSHRAARWVGEFLADHDHTVRCHCHRVVRATGEPGLFVTGDSAVKVCKLTAEGVPIVAGKILLDERRFSEFESPAPLRMLEEFQQSIPERVTLAALKSPPRFVAGLDISYRGDTAVAACVVLDAESLETVYQTTVSRKVRFPYIPGFLAFRELPHLLAVWTRAIRAEPLASAKHETVAMIDGNGILHPHRCGIATQFAITTGTPAIGVAKKLLCGSTRLDAVTPGSPQPVIHNDEQIGLVLVRSSESRPLFISPGSGLSFANAHDIVRAMFEDHRLPEPTFRADQLSRRTAKSPRE